MRARKGQRKLTEEQYDRFLDDYMMGEYGEAVLEPDEKRLTVRNRFKAAAGRRGIVIDFLRTRDNVLRFKVAVGNGQVDEQPQAVAPEPEPAPPKRKPGRPKKSA
jgi:hypothetical protein